MRDELNSIRQQWDEYYDLAYNQDTGVWIAQWKAAPAAAPINALDVVSFRDRIRDDFYARSCPKGGFYAGLSDRMST